MAQATPKVPTTRSADFVYYVADITAVDPLNLTQITMKPKCAAQRVFFRSTAGAAIVVTPELGPQYDNSGGAFNVTITLAANGTYTTEFPVSIIVSSSAAAEAIVMWWYGTGVDINK